MEDNFTDEIHSDSDEMPDFKAYQSPRQTPTKEINRFLDLFIPTEGYFIAPILIDINILIFILMLISGANFLHPGIVTLQKWGANFRPLTLEGQWWRLLTCCFIHSGIRHLIVNMFVLVYIGLLLEPLIGRTRFLAAYLLTGIVSSLTSLWWHDLIVSAGASGAIFGMCGVLLYMFTTDFIEKRNDLWIYLAVTVLISLIYGLFPGVDTAAHLGGLISGFIIGFAFMPGLRKPENNNLKYSVIGILTFVILIISITVYTVLPSNMGMYKEKSRFFMLKMERNYDLIRNYEAKHPSAIDEYVLPEALQRNTKIYALLKRGIYSVDERKRLITKVDDPENANDVSIYTRKMKTFISSEGMALDVYDLKGETSKNSLLYALKERGIYYWNENITLIDEIDKLNLPSGLHDKNKMMRQYCELRLKSYGLMYKVIDKENEPDKALIEMYNRQIVILINKLKSLNQLD